MIAKKRILLKLTGEAFLAQDGKTLCPKTLQAIIAQIKELKNSHQFGIVVGGGNFFRGAKEGKMLGMQPSSAHQVGILATTLNGIILKNLLEQQEVKTTIFCAIECPPAGTPISQQGITSSIKKDNTLVFTGGTGNPFFTTDTNAILRGLQMQADEIWKGTKVDGVYNKDPHKYADAQRYTHLTYKTALNEHLKIMDPPSYALAEEHNQTVRIFNIFEPKALIKAAKQPEFGSKMTT
ncbi:MAG: UMP kinase [Candidatus Dependentiae bacterium]